MLSPEILKEVMTVDDIELVLDTIGVQYRRNGTKSLVGKCPHPAHQDRKPSWDINIQKNTKKFGIHSCFSCGFSGDIVSLVRDVLGLKNRFQALKFINDLLNKTIDEEFLYERNLTHRKVKFEIRKKKVLKFSMPQEWELIQDDPEDPYYDYLIERDIDYSIIEKANIGKCMSGYYNKRVVVPVYFKNKIAFYFARNNDKIRKVPKEKRGLYPKFSKSSQYVYPYDWLDFELDYVILVEGIFDCLRMWSLGYKNVLCMFGNKISDKQAELIKDFRNVILVPDADGELDLEDMQSTRGQLMVQHAYQKLIHGHNVTIAKLPEGKDPGEATREEIEDAMEDRKTFFQKERKKTTVNYRIKKR